MGLFEVIMIGVGLSMDAFAASVCKGLAMRRLNVKNMLVIALFFGGFQAMMPCIGWFLGKQFEGYITSFDHWVAFALLAFIGGKMIVDVVRGGEENSSGEKNDCRGGRYEKKATLAGGIILVLIGLKILLEHLGVLG